MSYKKVLLRDRVLASIMADSEVELNARKNVALYLVFSIMSQQLSTKVAAVFHKRFIDLAGHKNPSVEKLAGLSHEQLRIIGLSNSKAQYVLNVARFFAEKKLQKFNWATLSDEEVLALLTQIKGVGKWTAEMVLMFALARPDVFPADDLGIQQAMQKAYGINEVSKKVLLLRMHQIAEKWRPYRTYACLHLWNWKDG
jgi:DNA-3-methyladenine glycosylase II